MITYSKIYNHLVDTYPADDVHAFFNQHEADVCKRRAVTLAEFLAEEVLYASNGRLKTGRGMAYAKAQTYANTIAIVIGSSYLRTYRLTEARWADILVDLAMEAAQSGDSSAQIVDLLVAEIAIPTIPELPEPEDEET